MNDAKTLKRTRGSIKARLTNFKKYIDALGDSDNVIAPVDEATIIETEQRLQRAEELFHEFEKCQSEIECTAETDEDFEEQVKQRMGFEESYFNIISNAKKFIAKTRQAGAEQSVRADSGPIHLVHARDSHGDTLRDIGVKLPKIKLPHFDGSYENWSIFYDTFQSLIHKNNKISDIEKFHYLRGALKDSAAKVIQHLEVSAMNYQSAWSLLEKRYENKSLMIHNHIKGIVGYPKIVRESTTAIRQLSDTVQGHLRALRSLKEPVDHWDSLLIFLVSEKFDANTQKEWESELLKIPELPTQTTLLDFLEKRCHFLEKMEKTTDSVNRSQTSKSYKQKGDSQSQLSHAATQRLTCPLCKEQHHLFLCKSFLDFSIQDRISQVKRLKLCFNCLRKGHTSTECKSGHCRKCDKSHNTLLHIDTSIQSNTPREETTASQKSDTQVQPTVSNSVVNHAVSNDNAHKILATAVVYITDKNGKERECVALLDGGSQSNFMTTSLCQCLNLTAVRVNIPVIGINQNKTNAIKSVVTTIKSKHNPYKATLSFLLLPRITDDLPSESMNLDSLNLPRGITLADPKFHQPKKIDILLGVDIFWDLICNERVDHPYLYKTQLGHVVAGQIPRRIAKPRTSCNLSISTIHNQLAQFWEVENCSQAAKLSIEEQACESHFAHTVKRDDHGRFTVSMPLKGTLDSLGDSKEQAIRRFLSLEKRLQLDKSLAQKYAEFMQQYEDLGHMVKVDDSNTNAYTYYMPHHGVLKENSLTTKLRVVFDASAPSSTNISLNDLQMIGPTIQSDLLSIVLRFRTYPYVMSADITMMYRQVLMTTEHCPLQRIVWRHNPTDPIQTFELKTVTYGIASSSFLAIRCLFELAKENETSYPRIAQIIRESMYVDDVLCGAHSVQEASRIAGDLKRILKSGGFELRKWIANHSDILVGMSNTDDSNEILELGANQNIKTLGLMWSCHSDHLIYQINIDNSEKHVSKRTMLSAISKIFDPLGLLSPCVVIAKMMLQELWLSKSDWDEPLTDKNAKKWKEFKSELSLLRDLRITRCASCPSPELVEIHGFSDASKTAYGACVYLRTVDTQGRVFVHLLCAKTKIAPLKPLTIPKLELSAAVILTRLVKKVTESIDIVIHRIYYWSDSTIALAWISTRPHLLKTFVSNRVSEIQSLSNSSEWRHIRTKENPADLLSRGLMPRQLKASSLWWRGPPWLMSEEQEWPANTIAEDTQTQLPEMKTNLCSHVSTQGSEISFSFENFSNLNRLERTIAWCKRFKTNCLKPKGERQLGPLTCSEINNANICLIKIAQRECFSTEIRTLLKGKQIDVKSNLLKLNPFVHSDGTLRVGGRLDHSSYNFNKKHPLIISGKHHLTKLIFKREHIKLLHVGPQALLAAIRDTYWPISGRNISKKIVHDCVVCFRNNPRSIQALMGDLPADRIQPSYPFQITGVDYGGPFLVKDRKGRGCKISKCYVSLFVCFATKAVHLELVPDLSTNAFILALRRFASRRGMPSKICSDNGTNFVGAHSELKELGNFLLNNHDELLACFTNERCDWSFIPAYSPHFGGLWESGIKSTKHHLKRVMGNALLTFEELYSLLTQIEAVLNSRPLTPLSSHPSDLSALTPAHFLIGRPLTSVPNPDVTHIPQSRLDRFQHLQQLQQHFWQRWSKEYISELQCRTKWKVKSPQICEGTLVLVKDDTPPMKWRMGRLIQLHPGRDSIPRVVSIQTSKGVIRRSVTKICPLPIDVNTEEIDRNKCEESATKKIVDDKTINKENIVSKANLPKM